MTNKLNIINRNKYKVLLTTLTLWLMLQGTIMSTQNITCHTLDNNMKVLLVKDPFASVVSVRSFVRAGSITEGEFLGCGVSHYLEHLVASGSTSKRSEKDYQKAISKLGGAYNAYTTTDHTSYFINTTPKHLNEAINIIYEWMFFCKFNQKEVDREKKVITKEIEKNNASISRKFYQQCQTNTYKLHPMRYPVIGYLENFKPIKRADLVRYYKQFYVPSNMVLVIGGNFDEDTILKQVKDTFGKAKRYASPTLDVFNEPKPFSTRHTENTGDTNVTYYSIRFSTVDLYSKDLYPLDLLDFIICNGNDSILYKTLVDKKKLAYNVNCTSYTPSFTSGYFEIAAEIDYENKDKVEAVIKEIVSNLKKGNLSNKLLERAKKQKLAEDILSISTIDDKVNRIGMAYLYGYSRDFFEVYINNCKKVTKKNIVTAANKYLDFEKAIYSILRPNEETKKQKTVTKEKKTVLINKPKKIVLANGVRVLLYPDKSLPKTLANIFVAGGIRAENAENNGIGKLTANLLGKGSDKYSKDKINEIIDDNGASLGASLGNNMLYYDLDCLAGDFNKLFPLMTNTFLKAEFSLAELNEEKRLISQTISQRKDDWHTYAYYNLKKNFFGKHPYGLSLMGEKKSIEKITVKDINNYFQMLLNPEQMVISVFGDFDEKKVISHINKYFSKLKKPKKTFDIKESLKRIKHKKDQEYNFEIPQDVGVVFIAFDGESFDNNQDIMRLNLVDAVLSGMNYPGGRLHTILREKGLVYMTHAFHRPGLENGVFAIVALTSPEKMDKVKEIIFDQIEDIKNKSISKKEFELALAQLNFYYKDIVSATDALVTLSGADEIIGRGYDFYTKIDSHIKKLTVADVQKTANKYLKNPQVYLFKGK
jgi:zinc protease